MDLSKLTMEFCYQGKTYRLVGIPTKELSVLLCHKLEKLFRVRSSSLILDVSQIYAIDNVYQVPPTIKTVIDGFSDLFCPPSGLPPTWYHDHRIILPPGTSPTNVRPYRYPMLQKAEIERMVKEMLHKGIIRPSRRPFSSHVLLFCKHDGTWRLCVDYCVLNAVTVKD
jgi:hypothetical protein